MKRFALALVALALVVPVPAAEPDKAVKLSAVAWLAGTWKSPEGERTPCEENWSEPAGGGMMGMFRFVPVSQPPLYEFQLLEEDADGVTLRLRHYRPRMGDMDKAPAKLRVTDASPQKIEFTNAENNKPKRIVYERDASDNLTVTVETERDDKPMSFTVKMARAKAK